MRTPGMLRKIDDLGRVVIPSEIRRALKMEKGDVLEISMEADHLLMKKFAPACIFCGGTEQLFTYEGKNICGNCISIIKKA